MPLKTSGPNSVLEEVDLGIKGHDDGSSYDKKLLVSMTMHLERMPHLYLSFVSIFISLHLPGARNTYVDSKKEEGGVRRPSDEAPGYLFDDLPHARILDG